MMRVWIALLAVGAAMIALGQAAGQPFIGTGVALLGAAAIAGGVDSVVTRRHRVERVESITALARTHTGASAVTFGVLYVAVGTVLVVGGVAAAIGADDSLWDRVADHPGVVATVIGACLILLGLALITSRWTYDHVRTSGWQRLPAMAGGAVATLIGLALLGIGRSLATDPPEGDEVIARILDTLARWLG